MAHRWLVLLLGVCGLLGGCGTLPDAKPFSDASAALAASVVVSGHAISDSLTEAGRAVPHDAQEYKALGKEFEMAWASRISAVQAAVTYSESIADLIGAGNQGAETVGKVADSLQALAAGVNIPMAAPAVGMAGDIVKLVYARIAIVRASDKLESALAQAQPTVSRVADHVVSESEQQLKPILLNVYKNIQSGIRDTYGADDNFALQARRLRDAQRQKALQDSTALGKLQEYDRVQETVAASLETRDRKLDQAAAAYKTRLQLVNALSAATLAWAQAHRDLATAVREKRKVSVGELQNTIVELKALAKKVSEL